MGKLGICDRLVTGGVSRKLRGWGEWVDFDTLLAGGIVFRDVGTPVLREFSPARRGILSLWREVSSPWRAMSLAGSGEQFKSFCPSGTEFSPEW